MLYIQLKMIWKKARDAVSVQTAIGNITGVVN